MLDCGCLDRFITEQRSGGDPAALKRLSVNTASPVKGEAAEYGEEGKKKRKTPTASAATPRTAKKVKVEKPAKASPSLSAAKKRKGAGAGSPVSADPAALPFPTPTPGLITSVPALVRSNTMPAEAASIMTSPTAYDGLGTPTAVVAAVPSSKASPSPRKPPAKAATPKRSSAVKVEKGARGGGTKRAVKVGLPQAAVSASAPNTPMSSRVLNMAGVQRRGGGGGGGGAGGRGGEKGGGRAGSPTMREPHSPAYSSASVLSSVSGSSSSSVYSVGVGESALSPTLHFSPHHHHSDALHLLPALSLPSSYPEVSLPPVMGVDDLVATDDVEAALYRSHFSARYSAKMRGGELVDDLAPHTSAYRYRPRTLSESHPSHPLHAMQDPSPAFPPHDFLVHEPSSTMPGDAAAPLSPQSYHSGDSMDTEHSSPIPDLEGVGSGGVGVGVDAAHKPVDGTPVSDSSWALNLDHMDAIAMPEMSVS